MNSGARIARISAALFRLCVAMSRCNIRLHIIRCPNEELGRQETSGAPRSLLKYPCTPRESALGRMARRERRAYPQRSVRSEQRRQTPQSALALRGGGGE